MAGAEPNSGGANYQYCLSSWRTTRISHLRGQQRFPVVMLCLQVLTADRKGQMDTIEKCFPQNFSHFLFEECGRIHDEIWWRLYGRLKAWLTSLQRSNLWMRVLWSDTIMLTFGVWWCCCDLLPTSEGSDFIQSSSKRLLD
jgi:hypothetical protein